MIKRDVAKFARRVAQDPTDTPELLREGGRRLVAGAAYQTAVRRATVEQKRWLDARRDGEEWVLIVLDACRYDYFSDLFDRFFDGELWRARSAGHDTFEYIRKCWPAQYPETVYVSGATPVNSDVDLDAEVNDIYEGYQPSDHIGEIVDVWDTGWSAELGTVPPRAVTDETLARSDESRLVAHYFQPHSPYIGDFELLGHADNDSSTPGDGEPVDSPIWRRVNNGEITDVELRRAYWDNLLLAAREVARLVRRLDHDNIYLIGDHGEALGEYGIYAHPRAPHPKIRTVPVARIDGVEPYIAEPDRDRDFEEHDVSAAVSERLESLGYLARDER